jgi:hypothetical protein
MVMRTDRLWTGGNVLKAAFASLHPYLSGAVAARLGGSHGSKSTRGLYFERARDTVRSVKDRCLRIRLVLSSSATTFDRREGMTPVGMEQPSQHLAAA